MSKLTIAQILKKTQAVCDKCGRSIQKNNFTRHHSVCDGIPLLRNERKKGKGLGKNWKRGKTDIEAYGKTKAIEISNKISSALTGKSTGRGLTEESEIRRRKKLAISMKGNKNGATSYRVKNIEYKGNRFKSGWELLVAEYLDSLGIEWKYEDTSFSLGEVSSYTPDFTIYENNKAIKYIEVKGYFRKENLEKFNRFVETYPEINIEVWNKAILLSKGLRV